MDRFHMMVNGEVVVVDRRITVGRSHECDVHIEDGAASRRHCAFMLASGRMWVEDLGSRNGVLVNGVPVRRQQELRHGDKVTVGSTLIVVGDPELGTLPPPDRPASAPPADFGTEATTGGHASLSHTLIAAADAALERRDVSDAVRSLEFLIGMVLEDLQARRRPPAEVIRETRRLALKMSSVTRDPRWLARLEELSRAGAK